MTNYQLAKLIAQAGGIRSRKRIQKTVHLLQAAGCPFNVTDYRIHYYGPYSKSLAGLVDQLASCHVLIEDRDDTEFGPQFRYRVDDEAGERLMEFERTAVGTLRRREVEEYADLLKEFNDTRSRILELAATIVAFHQAGSEWENAVVETAKFKRESEQSSIMEEAETLAKRVMERSHAHP
ncbi:MAG: hypothetical protein SH868_09420 [Bythopirellula sp.]|mgnify:CR=1 FL=1|nr:hypothetical protein [Bythopirellula sp.]